MCSCRAKRTSRTPGDMVRVKIVEAEEYDLIGERV